MGVELRGDHFLVCDFQFIPSKEEGLLVRLAPGTYTVEAAAMDYGGDRRIARLRVRQKSVAGKLGKKLGETWTDTACTSVCDFKAFKKDWDSAGGAAEDKLLEAGLDNLEGCGVFRLSKKGVPVVYATSGFGDGSFPVFELRHESGRVGFEIEFIAADTPYPWQTAAPNEPRSEKSLVLDKLSDELGGLAQSFLLQSTGDEKADSAKARAAYGEFFATLKTQARTLELNAAAEIREHVLQNRRKALPLTAEYRETAENSWLSAPQVESRASALKSAGFLSLGCFKSSIAPSLFRAGFIHPKEKCFATLDQTRAGVFLYINYVFADQTEDEFGDSPTTASYVRPPWLRFIGRPDLQPSDLIAFAARERRQIELKQVAANDYARKRAENWSRYVGWLAENGGHTAAYLKEKSKLTDSAEDLEKLGMLRWDEADRSLYNWLRLQRDLPFKVEDVLAHLVIVYDDLTPEHLRFVWSFGTNEIRVKDEDFAGKNPRETFAALNTRCGSKLRLVVEKRTGLAADYYLPVQT